MAIKKLEKNNKSHNLVTGPPLGEKQIKISIIGHNVFNSSTTWMADGFKRNPFVDEVHRYDYKHAVKNKSPNEIRNEIRELDAYYDLIIIAKGAGMPVDMIPREPHAIFYYWWMDWTYNLRHEMKSIASTCHYRSATGFQFASDLCDLLSLPAYHVLDGAEPKYFYRASPRANKIYDVSFVGSGNEQERRQINEQLQKEREWNIKFFGPQFTSMVLPDQYRDICNTSKIVLNLSRSDKKTKKNFIGYSSLRLWNLLSCGSMVLTKHIPSMEKFLGLEEGVHIVSYDGINDLKEKLKYYLTHDEEREKIAAAGWNYVSQNRTWDNVVTDIIQIIFTEPFSRLSTISINTPARQAALRQRRAVRPIRRAKI